jgi:hypothetical protein
MKRDKSRRLKALAAISDDYIDNPLIQVRTEHGFSTQTEFAQYLQVNKGVVSSAEEGMFQLIPAVYRKHIKDIYRINKQYQEFRTFKRQANFTEADFPAAPSPAKPMAKLLGHFDTNPYNFGARACVHHTEIWKMLTEATQLTANMVEFLDLIGISKTWQEQFNAALRLDHPSTLKLAK